MYFRILHDAAGGELTYLLADLQAREAVLIDPRGSDLTVLNAMLSERELRLRWVFRTHHHDHLNVYEAAQLARLGAPLVQGSAAEKVHLARDGEIFDFGGELMHVLATPGHTAGCLSFAWQDRIFCGGLLAVDACPYQPKPALPELLWDSVRQRLFTRPDETLLFGSSDQRAWGVSTVLEQRRWHPFFAGLSRDEFLARVATLPAQVVST